MLDEERYQAIREQLRPELAQSWRMLEDLDRKLEEVDSREQLRGEFWARVAESMAQAFELAAEQAGQQESSSKPPRS